MCCDNAKAPLNIYGSVIVILSGLISRICSRVVGLFNKSARCRNPNRVAAAVQTGNRFRVLAATRCTPLYTRPRTVHQLVSAARQGRSVHAAAGVTMAVSYLRITNAECA